MLKISPLAPQKFPSMEPIDGVELYSFPASIKYKNRDDLLLVKFSKMSNVAAVFTKSVTASVNIKAGREALKSKKAAILLVTSGNANAFNGDAGLQTLNILTAKCVDLFKCNKENIFISATGVIGQAMPDAKIIKALEQVALLKKQASWLEAAKAFMTTDSFPKASFAKTTIGNKEVKIAGIAKGSGMIEPNMATMLSYIFTDAKIPSEILQKLLEDACDKSFNNITVDSDTSTSDSLILFATCCAENEEIKDISDSRLDQFKIALNQICIDLARQVIKDGEGATKFITIKIANAKSAKSAKKIAKSIANSPLVKTAITGEDANWGRIIMAVGKAYEPINIDNFSIMIGGEKIVIKGKLNPDYKEQIVTDHMKGDYIEISLNIGFNNEAGSAEVWTCNLTNDYIAINADYRS